LEWKKVVPFFTDECYQSRPGLKCACSPDFRSGVVVEMDIGIIKFSAKELECMAENKVNFWSGEVEVNENKCSTVELSVIPL
jgi:hypothetical protein